VYFYWWFKTSYCDTRSGEDTEICLVFYTDHVDGCLCSVKKKYV